MVSNATDMWLEEWKVSEDNLSEVKDDDGKVVGYKSFLTVKSSRGYVNTGIEVYTNQVQKNIWYSNGYARSEAKLKEPEEWQLRPH